MLRDMLYVIMMSLMLAGLFWVVLVILLSFG